MISLVVPVRDEGDSLPSLIASIDAQTRQPDEIVIVDAGSMDGSPALVRAWAGRRSGVQLVSAGPMYPGAARNVGARKAAGDLIAFTDAGIELHPEWLAELYASHLRSDADVVFGDFEPLLDSYLAESCALAYVAPRPAGGTRGKSIASALVRRSILERVGGFPEFRAAEDLVFFERLTACGVTQAFQPRAVVRWRLPASVGAVFRRFRTYSAANLVAGRAGEWHVPVARMYLSAAAVLAIAALAWAPAASLLPVMGLARVGRQLGRRAAGGGVRSPWRPDRWLAVTGLLLVIDVATAAGWLDHLRGRRRREGALYICYQSVLEPLTETQVIAYLRGLAGVAHPVILLTFEPTAIHRATADDIRSKLAASGIRWHSLRYHKRPSVAATAFDVAAGTLFSIMLALRHRVAVIHARGHVSALMGRLAKRLAGARLLFDVRGFLAEEYVEAGVWSPGRRIVRITKAVERRLVDHADAHVVLTEAALGIMGDWYGAAFLGKPHEVIPCCVAMERFAGPASSRLPMTVVYAGKLGGWYSTAAVLEFHKALREMVPDARLRIITQSQGRALQEATGLAGTIPGVEVRTAAPCEVPALFAGCSAGLSFITPSFAKRASSPTKVAEYLAAGLPVVASSGVGDCDALLTGAAPPVGVLVRNFEPQGMRIAAHELLRLIEDPAIGARCRAVAQQQLDLEQVGHVRYRALYRSLMAPA